MKKQVFDDIKNDVREIIREELSAITFQAPVTTTTKTKKKETILPPVTNNTQYEEEIRQPKTMTF